MNAVALKPTTATDRKEWIGGSDIAPIMGCSPWATAADIYYRKIGQAASAKVDPVRERIYKRGKRLEPIVIEMLHDELGIEVTKVSPPENPNRYTDGEFPFLAAEIDFEWRVRPEDVERFPWAASLRVGSIQNGEVKTVSPFLSADWGDMDTDEVPIAYAFQSLHGLGVTGRDVCLYGALFGADNLVTYAVPRDDETILHIRKRAVSFWKDNVLARVVPPPQTLDDLARMYLKASLAKTTADADIARLVAELHGVKDQIQLHEQRAKELEFAIKNAIGNAEALVDERGRVLCTWKNSTYSHLEVARLKERHPDIYAEFYESRPTRRFYLTGRRSR